ncbi:uncharacterized protein LOC114756827 [Neltuma alba]|uniref:uncharacterized protein LOC114756827 n=1 Tax=Neltuma alba TaxID=207710 RepID=UPI0010A3DDC0|nr:uncharacterized protein LOC114756827 [Prosopis alba]
MDSDVLYLPQEIIRNILKRLPSSNQNPSLLLECNGSHNSLRRRLGLLDCGLQVRKVQRAPLIDSLSGARILGSCNGMLCVEINQYNKSPPSLSLWNPATTAVKQVPRTRTDGFDFDDCVTGFGGSWKVIDIGNLKGVKLESQTVTANGAIFWYGVKLGAEGGEDNIEAEEDEYDMEESEDEVEVIVSFDIAKEVFTLIPRPNLDYNADEKLTVYENKLAILCDVWEDDDETADLIDLWVLDEGACASGETWSWTRRYTSSPFSRTLESMTMWRNEIICKATSAEDNEKGRNVLYSMNITTNEVKRFVVSNFAPIHSIYDYAESLVFVGNSYIEDA